MVAQSSLPKDFQQQILDHGKRLLDTLHDVQLTESKPHQWLDLLISRTISDPDFRIQALRFIDVLPTLDNDQDLALHLQEYFSDLALPRFAEWSLNHSDTPWATRIAAPTVRYTLRGFARKFMGGSQLHHALTTVSRLRHQHMNFTLDLLGEATISEKEAAEYQQHYQDMLQQLSGPIYSWSHNELLDTSHGMPAPKLNLSIKLSSLYSQIRGVAPDASCKAILERLRAILRSAIKNNAFITIDMEQYDFKHIVLQCFKQIIMEDEFIAWPHIGIAIQAYLKESYPDLQRLITLAQQRKTPFTIRLVRGAYWDYETVIARQNNWPCPVWENKNDTDYNYEQCLYLLLTSHNHVHTAIATHNPRSIAYSMALIQQLKLTHDQYEFQMLYGMADPFKHSLEKLGHRLRVYVPFGETLPGMAYLVRRLLENASGRSLLDTGFGNLITSDTSAIFEQPLPVQSSLKLTQSPSHRFVNTATLRFTNEEQRKLFSLTLEQTKQTLGRHYPLIINGEDIDSSEKITSINPAEPEQIIGTVSSANHKHADQALMAAKAAFPSWSQTAVQQRADYLRRVANLLLDNRYEFSAMQVLEAGKNWQEADADVCEAIDFINYYAQQAEILLSTPVDRISGEDNQLIYKARGISLVIAPWNFPLAILCGMLSASIVTGNTCILKPASLTPVIAAKLMQLWKQVELPDGVINFLPGPGKVVAEYLSRKPDIHIISFTGSLQVGTQLIATGAQIQHGQTHIKKVIAEMGGKNAIIIDSDADFDDAIIGTLQSAFGFQGQKCSAASRVIVIESIYEKFVDRLLEAASSLTMGSPIEPENFIGPVIDEHAYNNIQQTISNGMTIANANFLFDDTNIDKGYFINPCIFTDVDPESPLAQEEIFGPVLSVIKANNFEHAIKIANSTRYALTGGVYSRQPSHLDYAKQFFNVGNLYLNRKITGAIVQRQPFGGFAMSGAGSKTGGSDYLQQYMDCCNVTENTLRRGFAPEPE